MIEDLFSPKFRFCFTSLLFVWTGFGLVLWIISIQHMLRVRHKGHSLIINLLITVDLIYCFYGELYNIIVLIIFASPVPLGKLFSFLGQDVSLVYLKKDQ